MEILENSRFGFITYRPQISYPSLTLDFLNIILPKLKSKCNYFLWAIEDYEEPSQHIHIFFKLHKSETKKQKIKQNYIDYKEMKNFLKYTIEQCSCGPNQLDIVLVPEGVEPAMTKIGYCLKQNPIKHEIMGIPKQIITESIKFYKSIEKTTLPSQEDWDLITPKNVYTKLPFIFKKHNIDPYGPDFLYNCSIQNIGVANISFKQLKTAYLQLKIKSIYKDKNKTEILQELKDKLNQEAEWEFDQFDFQADDKSRLINMKKDIARLSERNKELDTRNANLRTGNQHYQNEIKILQEKLKQYEDRDID